MRLQGPGSGSGVGVGGSDELFEDGGEGATATQYSGTRGRGTRFRRGYINQAFIGSQPREIQRSWAMLWRYLFGRRGTISAVTSDSVSGFQLSANGKSIAWNRSVVR